MLRRDIEVGAAAREAPVAAGETGSIPRQAHLPGLSAGVPRGNVSPVLRVDRNGILQDANEPGQAAVATLGCRVGERLPEYITQLIPGVLLSGRRERVMIDCNDQKISLTVTMCNDPGIDGIVRSRSPHPMLVLVDDEDSEYSALRALPVALYTSGPEMERGATWVSPGVEELTGFPPSKFTTGEGFWISRIHPDDLRGIIRELSRGPKKGKLSLEYRFRCADGSFKWILDHIVMPPGLNKGYGILQDIDRRKKAELSATERGDFLEKLMEGASHGIIILDDEKCLAFMSPQIAARLGYGACDWVTKRTKLVFHPRDREAGLEAISDALRGIPGRCRGRIMGTNGNSIHVQLYASSMQWRGKRLVLCMVGDISEQMHAEAERTACISEGIEELLGAVVAALAPGIPRREALGRIRRNLGEKGKALLQTFGGEDP